MTYLWEIPNDYPSEWIGEYDTNVSPDRFLLRKGEPVPTGGQPPTVRFNVDVRRIGELDVLPNNAMVPLVSEEVLAALTGLCASDVEAVAATVVAVGGSLKRFSFVNVLAKVAAIDMAGSDCLMIPGTKQVMKFRRLRLLAPGIGQHHFARDPRYASYLFVSDELKRVFDEAGWKHCAFKSPDDVRP